MKQAEIWKNHIMNTSVDKVIEDYNNPAIFQRELKLIIDQYKERSKKIIEIGCETGVTSFILDNSFDKTLLDLNPYAIKLAKQVSQKLNLKASFVEANMFNIPIDDETYDIVFNAGVIEHFNYKERSLALKEYARIMKSDGVMIIAFPNHFSIPYRLAYLVRNYILFKWPYPKEHKIYNLKKEIQACNLFLEDRLILSRSTIFNWWNFLKPVKSLFKFLDKFINYEGYLTVLLIRKKLFI